MALVVALVLLHLLKDALRGLIDRIARGALRSMAASLDGTLGSGWKTHVLFEAPQEAPR